MSNGVDSHRANVPALVIVFALEAKPRIALHGDVVRLADDLVHRAWPPVLDALEGLLTAIHTVERG